MLSRASKHLIHQSKNDLIVPYRVVFKIAEEVAKQKFCQFTSLREAIEAGIRVSMAYYTLGVVSSPIEGFTELKIEKNIIFTGPLSEKEKYAAIASSKALILPSSFEAQGLVLLEAQAIGTPVIATKQGGIPYFIRNNENGILC